jgi:CheY-like chemotaxis protein
VTIGSPLGLVVDDDADVRLVFSDVLRHAGMRVMEASSGNEAQRLAAAPNLAFVVTDIEMPDGDGWELCRALRGSDRDCRLAIVVVTGVPLNQVDAARAAGCDVVLEKPCSPALLLATIRRLLTSRSSTRAGGR